MYIHKIMKAAVAKWGNSLAVRLPQAVSTELGLDPGTWLDLVVEKGEIRLRRPKVSAASLLAALLGIDGAVPGA